jgi:hypothetical protein
MRNTLEDIIVSKEALAGTKLTPIDAYEFTVVVLPMVMVGSAIEKLA